MHHGLAVELRRAAEVAEDDSYTDEEPPAQANPVTPARRSASAEAKASHQHDDNGRPYLSYRGLLDALEGGTDLGHGVPGFRAPHVPEVALDVFQVLVGGDVTGELGQVCQGLVPGLPAVTVVVRPADASEPDPELESVIHPAVNARFWQLKHQLNDNPDCHLELGFEEGLVHLIYAGADLLVMPSLFEPCGLSQLIALKYGTVPIVRATGGLVDTVFDRDYSARHPGDRNGYVFHQDDNPAVESAMARAIGLWYSYTAEFRHLMPVSAELA